MGRIHRFESLASTMDHAHELARGGAEHGTVVVAKVQTAARGSRGRAWLSPEGGLWFSVVVKPPDPHAVEVLPIRVGLVVASMLESSYPDLPPIQIKWPNDLLLNGRKIGGVLCEAHWGGERCLWAVVGVGVNVRNEIPEELRATASRLADFSVLSPADDLPKLLSGWISAVARYPASLSALELSYWAKRDALLEQRIEQPVAGIASGITPRGALRVRNDAGVVQEATSGVASTAL